MTLTFAGGQQKSIGVLVTMCTNIEANMKEKCQQLFKLLRHNESGDGRTDRRTDRQTDRQTDRRTM